ncbi:hypothetical protein HZB00_01255 [Candidatus Woesearchaeota archaeon]|nr:hypothetical protein [Candidatus Woesearchaeota archaeon]
MDLLKYTQEIASLQKEIPSKPVLSMKEEIIPQLTKLLEQAVNKRVNEKIGIAFSGGVDSTFLALLCSKLKKEFILYNIGLENSQDSIWAKKIASYYNWPLQQKIITKEGAESIVKKVIKIIPNPNVIRVGVACPEYAVLELARKDNIKTVLGGLGSEEIFAGYERHRKALEKNEVHEESWKGLLGLWERDLTRDIALSEHFNIALSCPFLDRDVVKYSMQVVPELKISPAEKKLILRETALAYGLPREFAFRPKKAAQYGSGFDSFLDKLTKKYKVKTKQELLEKINS